MEFAMRQQSGAIPSVTTRPDQGETDFRRWRDSIGDAANRVDALAEHVSNLGNELFGAEPQAVEKSAAAPDPHCQVAALDIQLGRLRASLDILENRLSRLNRLV